MCVKRTRGQSISGGAEIFDNSTYSTTTIKITLQDNKFNNATKSQNLIAD